MMHRMIRLAAFAALLGVAGCVGQPQAYGPGPGYAARGPYGGTCFAGNYSCPLPQAAPVGAQCSCPGLGAPSYGRVQ